MVGSSHSGGLLDLGTPCLQRGLWHTALKTLPSSSDLYCSSDDMNELLSAQLTGSPVTQRVLERSWGVERSGWNSELHGFLLSFTVGLLETVLIVPWRIACLGLLVEKESRKTRIGTEVERSQNISSLFFAYEFASQSSLIVELARQNAARCVMTRHNTIPHREAVWLQLSPTFPRHLIIKPCLRG